MKMTSLKSNRFATGNAIRARLWMAALLVAGFALPQAVRADELDDLGEAVKTVMRTSIRPSGSVFARSYKSKFYETSSGRHYAFLELQNKEGSRCTLNFDRKWHYVAGFKLYILNVPPAVREKMSVQLMKDPRRELNYEVTAPLKHGDSLDLGRRDDCYFSELFFDAGEILREHPYAVIALVQNGIDLPDLTKKITFNGTLRPWSP